jgi:hypothetical protein
MKKLSIYSIPIIFIFLIFGCKKNDDSSNINFLKNTQTRDEILDIKYDDEDLKVREAKWAFGEALKNTYIAYPYILDLILEDAKLSPKKEADILRICNKDNKVKTLIASNLKQYKKSSLTDDEVILDYISKLTFKSIEYAGVIKIYNFETLNKELFPIISNGLDVSEKNGQDDGIFAYKFNSATDFEEINIDENIAKQINNPIIIFQNGVKDEDLNTDKFRITPFVVDESNLNLFKDSVPLSDRVREKATQTYRKYDYLHIGVKAQAYHYDGCCNNNIAVAVLTNTPTNTSGVVTVNSSTTGGHYKGKGWKNVIGLSKGQCNGTQFTQWGDIYHPGYEIRTSRSIDDVFYFLPYERDWYASWKYISFIYKGTTVWCSYDATYQHENYGHGMGHWSSNMPTTGVLLKGIDVNLWQYLDFHSNKMKFAVTRTF